MPDRRFLGDLVEEVQRGPEAERLILLVDELEGEKIWQEAIAHGINPAMTRENRD